MPKILWVALPLLLAAALLVLQVLRRRQLPSRQALNVWSSLLLAAYVCTTAGLGIFWVANQQLPVFDWHYLFGYATALLVVLHLGLNIGSVWRYLTRSRRPSSAGVAAAAPRRRAFAVAGALLATGAGAFLLGLRHGRSDLHLEWPGGAGTQGGDAAALRFVEHYHAHSSHSRAAVLLRAPGVDWGDPPPPFKRYPGAASVALPEPRRAAGGAFDVAALGTALWHTAGITDASTRLALRASPSSGALFSTELYLAANRVPGLERGLWHYDPQAHALQRLGGWPQGLPRQGGDALPDAPAWIVATAVFRRTGHKYRDRTYRYILADLGHALENLHVAAAAVGIDASFGAPFDEARLAALLGVDEAEEGVLALVSLQPAGAAAPPPAGGFRPRWRVPQPPADGALPLGLTASVHRATSLTAGAPPPQARDADAAPALPASAVLLQPAAAAGAAVLDVIAARRSVRRYAAAPLALEALTGVLAGLAADAPLRMSNAVRVDVVVHAVRGLDPGVYRHEPTLNALVPRRAGRDLRAEARAAALDQDVIGDAAAVFVLSIERAALAADPLGPARGYRHAFLEAGRVGERVYLEAGARGLAACAVGAFYDDEAAALVGIDPAQAWVVHFAALGVGAA